MNLSALLSQINVPFQIAKNGQRPLEISYVSYDSRKVGEGFLFVAISGMKDNGFAYIPQAIERGATVIVAEALPMSVPDHVTVITTPDARRFLSSLSAAWWGLPDKSVHLVGVTGTNGKTTTTKLIKWLWESNGTKSGLVGTINNMAGGKVLNSTHTTPESWELFELLSMMKEEGCKNAVMEVSSHALSQCRVADCHYDGIIFTNLSQDHLDYHSTFENYLESKLELFRMTAPEAGKNKYAIVNLDDPMAKHFIKACQVELWTYGVQAAARVMIKSYHIKQDGSYFTLVYGGNEYNFYTPLIGKFNIYNSVNAICAGLAEGLDITEIIEAIKHSPQVAGRFERIDEGQDYTVIVDYAHSPDGLINLLSTARDLNPRRLITVFGCGGDRDKTKRPIMGGVAGQYSDFSIITSDNPRTEDPYEIIAQTEEGMLLQNKNYLLQPNRREAIKTAIEMAEMGDIVVIAGKGHEDYQLIKGQVLHFDDREVAREMIAEKESRSSS